MNLDDIDVKILKILQADGRLALSEIARRLNMGTATIHERVNSLEEDGYIRDYRAVLDPELLGLDNVAFVRVHTEAGHFSEVAERLTEETEIQEIHEITGDADLLLKVRVGNHSELTSLLSRIGEYDAVLSTATDVALRNVKEEQRFSLSE
ncbi:Lrp/AsnC family transcriptional regulator [Haladaptatus caseinilyticus]|uniref:Lrp/AsnC family transcriptional regulator n=1 Tax=Haladaptatus caseinilyticus TaxID=2993314 RepID=UPI00224B76D7|nr:Lrp/AsnC family transcriptional regulator [Haladaptatus caseinilyticus]